MASTLDLYGLTAGSIGTHSPFSLVAGMEADSDAGVDGSGPYFFTRASMSASSCPEYF